MRIAIISTDYFPLRSSAAVQLRDLAQEILGQGHQPVVLAPGESQRTAWVEQTVEGVRLLRLSAPRMKEVNFGRRALGELWMPFAMIYGFWRSGYRFNEFDGVVWYSPSIFLGPLVAVLKWRSRCRTYLILRDIFPEWARDLGLIGPGPVYQFFRGVARYQYSLADTIGVQTPSNLGYLQGWAGRPKRRLEVLQNWLAVAPLAGSSIQVSQTRLAARTIFVYIGNMGVAQGMDALLDLASGLRHREDFGFIFVGRGTAVARLRDRVATERLESVLFYDEVDPREMPALLAQCQIGLLALDPRHRSHNIPGKFLTYLQAGLPILARINAGTDLVRIIEEERVGLAYCGDSGTELCRLAEELVARREEREGMSKRGRELSERMFSPTTAVNQILQALQPESMSP